MRRRLYVSMVIAVALSMMASMPSYAREHDFKPSLIQLVSSKSYDDEEAATAPSQSNDDSSSSSPNEPPLPPQDDQVVHEGGSVTLRLGPANIQTFYPPDLKNFSRAYVKLAGVDMNNERLVDEFAAINYCKAFKENFQNEFTWRYARKAIRKIIERDLETYGEYFLIDGRIKIGRYDFTQSAFLLDEANAFKNVGLFMLKLTSEDGCIVDKGFNYIPTDYVVRLDNPVFLERIPIQEKIARELLELISTRDPLLRQIYVTFFFRINDFSVVQKSSSQQAVVRATLLALRFYASDYHQFLLYNYRSPGRQE